MSLSCETNLQCILVKGWGKSASWTFPKGKINQHEDQRDCALREVLEETGYDASALLPKDSKDYLEHRDNEQRCRLYIVPGVPRDTKFETQTRHEISRVEWFKLGDLPTAKKPKTPAPELGGRFYRVMPFMMRLRRWIQTNKRSHPKKPKQTAPKEKDTSLNMDELFGAQPRPVGTQKPGLIALPPEAMKQISGKAKAAAASSSRSSPAPTPAPASAQPAHNDDSRKNLLLSLLHGPQEPLPAPPQIAEQPRVDGSSALRNLLGMHQSHANTPSQPGSQQQRSLLSILQGPPKPQGQQPTPQSMPMPPMQGEWPGVLGAHGASSTPSALSAGPMSPAQTSLPNEHRAKLLPNLMASSSQPPPAVAPPMHAHPNGVHPMPVPVPPPVRSPSTAHGYPGIPLPRPMSVQSPVQHAPQSPHSAPVGVSSSQQHALLSTLLGPKPQSPAQTHAVSPHAQAQPSNLVSSPPPPQPGAQNTMNLLNILNGPAPPKQNTPPSTSALNAQNASNSLLNTLLHGKGA